jgi:GNAT superfamily N-acetyltransferase
MPDSILIRPITEIDFPTILAISNNRFGEDYLDMYELSTYLTHINRISVVALVNDKIAGFALAQVCDQNALMSLVFCEHDWFREQFLNKYPIGILKTIAVDHKFSNLGIGTALTTYRIDILKKSTNSILAVNWEQKEHLENSRLLEKCGLSLQRRIERYWMEDSLAKGYTCVRCGAPPCKCAAMIYTM